MDAILLDHPNNYTFGWFWINKIPQDVLMDNFVHTNLRLGKILAQMESSSNSSMD